MNDVWLISDTHFLHRNILTFADADGNLIRGDRFSSCEEMNEYMIEQWNSSVAPSDTIYHLGDVSIGPKEDFLKIWKRLNGKKHLIAGNHDDIKFMAKNDIFKTISIWKQLPDLGLVLSHIPLDPSQLWRYRHGAPDNNHAGQIFLKNVHGHIHQKPSPTDNHFCVCVEHTDYAPVHVEDVVNQINKRG